MRTDIVPTAANAAAIFWKRISPACVIAEIPVYRDWAPHPVEGTGAVYVVVALGEPGMLSRSRYHPTMSRPRVALSIYADHLRGEGGAVLNFNAQDRALAVWEYINPLVDGMTSQRWPDVIACERLGEPRLFDVPDGDGAVMLSAVYDVDLWGSQEIHQ